MSKVLLKLLMKHRLELLGWLMFSLWRPQIFNEAL